MKHLFIFIFAFSSCVLNAHQEKKSGPDKIIDSLLSVLKNAKQDTNKLNTLNFLSRQYISIGSYEKTIQYALQAIQESEKFILMAFGNKKTIANAYNNIAIGYWYQGNYEKSLQNYLISLKIREEIGDKNGIVNSYRNMAIIYDNQGNHGKALDNHLKALKIMEELKDKKGIATSYRDIGSIYMDLGNYEKAYHNNLKSVTITEKMGDKSGLAESYGNIGTIYLLQGNYEKALDNQLKALNIKEQNENKEGLEVFYDNIATIYMKQGDSATSKVISTKAYQNALDYQLKTLKIKENIGDNRGIAIAYNTIGNIYMRQNKLQESCIYMNKSYNLFNKIKYKDGIKDNYFSLSEVFNKKGDYKKAFEYHKLFSDIKDSILNEQSARQIAEMDTKYESEKKEKNIVLLTRDKALQQADLNKQKFIRNGFIGGLILALLLGLILYNRFVIKKKLNTILSIRNNELIQKNTLIENQKEKIIDSITYAQLIQQSILMEENEIQKLLPDSFIYYQPKDIVSGDFYWCSKINDKIILAAIDCTGHGVPGAFMSMIGNTLLNQIVNEKNITIPSEILRLLNIGIYEALHQEKEETLSRDGMDIALCCIDYKKNQLEYAGAQNPLYMVSDNKLIVIKADRMTIGGGGMISKKVNPLIREYTNHTISIKKDMCIYLFSDGYMDQFRGSDRIKFGMQQFKDLILKNQQLSMQNQKELFALAHKDWKGKAQQIDDILLIGLRL